MASLKCRLQVCQQPERARLCSYKEENETIDRRPVDPPPVVEVVWFDGYKAEMLDASTLFIRATIVNAEPELSSSPEDYAHVKTSSGAEASTGELIQTPEKLKALDGTPAAMCIFAKLSVRLPGIFRLKFTLFESASDGVHEITHTVSDPFEVYSPKLFRGMKESTPLTRHLAAQGLKIKLRTDTTVGRQQTSRQRPPQPSSYVPPPPHSHPNAPQTSPSLIWRNQNHESEAGSSDGTIVALSPPERRVPKRRFIDDGTTSIPPSPTRPSGLVWRSSFEYDASQELDYRDGAFVPHSGPAESSSRAAPRPRSPIETLAWPYNRDSARFLPRPSSSMSPPSESLQRYRDDGLSPLVEILTRRERPNTHPIMPPRPSSGNRIQSTSPAFDLSEFSLSKPARHHLPPKSRLGPVQLVNTHQPSDESTSTNQSANSDVTGSSNATAMTTPASTPSPAFPGRQAFNFIGPGDDGLPIFPISTFPPPRPTTFCPARHLLHQ